MLLPKKNRVAVYSHLFKEGVMVAHKDYTKAKHESIDVSNLEVIHLMTSLKSRGYVRETFSWQWFYWFLTEEGVKYLREYLHLPEGIVPQTHKKQQVTAARPSGNRSYGGEGRGGYGKDGGAGRDFNPQFQGERGGFGRGSGGQDGYRREGGFGRGN
uniref:Plectin/eS10 N-terminal domain-containing protein n=2 Tax=Mucochytrium quahogii TaxID=96639 RepID=A0A7S2RBH2_9STRA|mmetsp:Transcript_8293/g.13456  ORF Transcript_8293/g.13456 Transcript_8293/m.13456 type:complete len:157 (-) Transcript_8293:56-526(-)